MSDIVTSGSLSEDDASVPVGVVLARLRHARELTGHQLGELVGMSQAKISKIETGAVVATPRDVLRLGRALQVSPDLIEKLSERAEASHNQMTDWRLGRGGLAAGQREIAQLEAATTVFRIFQPAAISGLLQTTEYARAVLASMERGRSEEGNGHLELVPEAVSARVQRQEVLADPEKRFIFIMPETVLQHLVCRATDMPAQIERIRDVSKQENVSVAFIPATVQLAYPPYHGFMIFDERSVLIDLFNTFLTSRGRSDVRLYRRVFDGLERQAVVDVNHILDKYLELYLDLARQDRRADGR